MKVVGFCGASGSGKTTLIASVIRELRAAGQRVSVVKHAHKGFDVDIPGKDSHRLREAGAFETVVASGRRLAKIREFGAEFDITVHQLLAELVDCDWALVEGFKHADLLRIEVWRPEVGPAVPQYPDEPYIVGIATPDAAALPTPTARPVFALGDGAAVARYLLDHAERFEYTHAHG